MRRIITELRIAAHDQWKVFVELASSRKLSPRVAEDRYGLPRGKANAYVEFNIEDEQVATQYNTVIRLDECFITGDIDLTTREAEAFFNF